MKDKVIENRCNITLPISEFKQLIFKEEEKNESPIKYLVKKSEYKLKTDKNSVLILYNLDIVVLTKDEITINLFNKEVILLSSKVNRGSIGFNGDYYSFFTKGVGEYKLEIIYEQSINTIGNFKDIVLDNFVNSLISISFPKDEEYKIPTAISISEVVKDNENFVKAYVKPEKITISWGVVNKKREREEVKVLPTIIHSTIDTLIDINERSISCRSKVDLVVYQTPILNFSLEIHNAQVIDIKGDYIKRYDVSDSFPQTVTIYFEHEVEDDYDLTIYYEKELNLDDKIIDIPALFIPNIEREEGFLILKSKMGTDIKIKESNNIISIDNDELPHYLKRESNIKESFKYLVAPYSISLEIIKHKEIEMLVSLINNAIFTTTLLKKGIILTKVNLEVKNNSKPFMKIKLPENSIPLSSFIKGNPIKPIRGDDGSMMLPLPKFSSSDEFFWIEFIWLNSFKKMAKSGKINLKLADIDMPISHFYWNLYLPENFKYKNFKGNIEKLDSFKTTPPYIPYNDDIQFPKEGYDEYYDEDDDFEDEVMAEMPMMEEVEEKQEMSKMFSGGNIPTPAPRVRSMRPKLKKMAKPRAPKPIPRKVNKKSSSFVQKQVGKLPVKISIPLIGDITYYEKLFVEDKIYLNFDYKKKGRDKVKPL